MRLAFASALLLGIASTTFAGNVYTVTDFDDVPAAAFSPPGAINNADVLGDPDAFVFNGNAFNNSYNPAWNAWQGWAISNQTAPLPVGTPDAYYINEHLAAPEAAASGANYAIAFSSMATINLAAGQKAYSIDLTNTWYAEQLILTGNNYGRRFVTDDYFTLTINGYAGSTLTGSVVVTLADYRDNKSFVRDTWETVSLLDLGDATTLKFSFFSTDTHPLYGIQTPAYVAVDNFTTYASAAAVPEPASWALMALGTCAALTIRRRSA